jgi:PAS domain S-box-containing protein
VVAANASSRVTRHLLLIYYALGALGVITVATSLYLNHRIMTIYTGSVEANQRWARRLTHYSELGQLAAAVNAPPNDVFDSHDVEAEATAMRAALPRFNESLTALRDELRANVTPGRATPFVQEFQAVEAAMAEMTTEASQVFVHYARNELRQAGQRMAAMDHKYADVNAALARLRAHIGAFQSDRLDEEIRAAAALQGLEHVMGLLVVLMVGGTTAYGYKLAMREAAHERETDRHIASLRDAEARTRSILDTAADGIVTFDEQDTIDSVNHAAEAMFGMPASAMIGRSFSEFLLSPEEPDGGPARSLLARKDRSPEQGRQDDPGAPLARRAPWWPADLGGRGTDVMARRHDDTVVPLELAVSEMRVDRRRMFTAVLRDISERKRAEEALRVSEERLAAIIGTAMDAIISLDEHHRVALFNASAEKIFGCAAADAIGQPLDRFLPERFREHHRHHVQQYAATGATSRSMQSPGTLSGRRANGEEFPLEATISLARVAGHTLLTVILRDLTERKQAEELARLYAKTKEIDQLKTEFIYNLSHELRTPLTTIREGVSQVTEGLLGATTSEQRDFLSVVLHDIDRLSRIIDDLLDEAKIEAGRLELVRSRVNLVEIARQAAHLFGAKARAKGIHLRAEFSTPEIEVDVDPDKIAQVFANLVGNALKFTESGEVVITVDDMGPHVACAVRDTGHGIAPEDLPKVFQKFYQVSRTTVTGGKGTGLGLPIAKAIVESHGGTMSVTSQPGMGSTFTFVLPKTPA